MTKKGTSSITEWIYLLFWAILPFISVSSLVDNTLIPRQIYLAVFVLIGIVSAWKALSSSSLKMSFALLSYLGFFVISAISSFWAINTAESLAVLARYSIVFSFLFLSMELLKSKKLSLESFTKGILVFAAIAAIFAAFQLLKAASEGEFLDGIYSVKGAFSHKNLLSSVLMLSLPFTVIGFVKLKTWQKKASLALLFLIIAEIFVLRTRGVWLSTFLGALAAATVFYFIRKKPIDGLIFPKKLFFSGLALAFVVFAALFSTKEVQSTVTDQTNLETRIKFWENSLEMLQENPILGVGPGNWKINFPKYNLQGLDNNVMQGITHIQRPHNDYLWVLSEGGPLSLIFYLGIFVFTFLRIRKNIIKAEKVEDISVDLALIFGLVAYLSFSITDFPMERISINALLVGLIALAHRKDIQSKIVVKGRVIMTLSILLCLASLYVLNQRFKGEKASVEVLKFNRLQDPKRIVPAVDAAENEYFNLDNYSNPLRYFSAMGKLVQNNAQGALADIEIAEEQHPNNILVLNLKANALKSLGKNEEALVYLNKATDIAPRFEQALLNKAEIYYAKKDYEQVLRNITQVIPNIKNQKFTGLLIPTLMELVKQDAPYFKKLKVYLKNGNPNSPDAYYQLYTSYLKNRKKPSLEGNS